MKGPTFDADGYPTEETLQAIREWNANDLVAMFNFIGAAWRYHDYWHRDGDSYHFSTGGWSGNEDLLDALEENRIAWILCWYSSRRGGHYVFELPAACLAAERKAKESGR